jgi:rubrerythrin
MNFSGGTVTTTNLLDAIHVVKENERIASEHYAEAAGKMQNPRGRILFMELSAFEKYHLQQLTHLEKSILDSGNFISYDGKAFPLPPKFDIKAAEESDRKSVMRIITEAIELEKTAEKASSDLAAQVVDPYGHRMFLRLSEEEHNHYRILNEAYWALNDLGVWKWMRL